LGSYIRPDHSDVDGDEMERTRHETDSEAALRVVGGTESDRARQADEADRLALGALYDTIRRVLPTLDPELSEVRASLLALAPRLRRACQRPDLRGRGPL